MKATIRAGASPVTLNELKKKEELAALYQTELERVSKSAESWRTGLAGLLALIATVSVVSGRTSIEDLAPRVAWGVGVLIAAALFAAALGALLAMLAAYGLPQMKEAVDLLDWRRRAAKKAALNLQIAIFLSFATLVLLSFAVGLTWYGPEKEGKTAYVTPAACQEFTSAANLLTLGDDPHRAKLVLETRELACVRKP